MFPVTFEAMQEKIEADIKWLEKLADQCKSPRTRDHYLAKAEMLRDAIVVYKI